MTPHKTTSIPDNMIDEILFEIPEVASSAVTHHLQRSIVRFCEIGHYWKEELDAFTAEEGVLEYELAAPSNTAIVSVISVETDEYVLVRNQSAAIEYRFWQESPFSLLISPIDKLANKDVTVIAAVKPIIGANFKFTSSLLLDYREALLCGAKAQLYKTPRKPWTDLAQAQINEASFSAAANSSLLMQARGYTRLPDGTSGIRSKARTYY